MKLWNPPYLLSRYFLQLYNVYVGFVGAVKLILIGYNFFLCYDSFFEQSKEAKILTIILVGFVNSQASS